MGGQLTDYGYIIALLTLGACARVTVVVLCVLCVCVSVCLSVTTLTATYLVCDSKLQCYTCPMHISNAKLHYHVWVTMHCELNYALDIDFY